MVKRLAKAVMKKVKQLKSWSFSRYRDYVECPLKARFKHVDRIKEPENDAMRRGTAIHKLAEDYIKGKKRTLAPELKSFEGIFAMLRAQYKKKINGMVVEDTWAFTKDWTETQWDDWVGCMVRIKLDCAHHEDEETLIVTDWKTGKFREEKNAEYEEQLELYALAALLLHDHIQQVKPRLAYTDLGIFYPLEGHERVFTRKDIPKLKALWAKRTRKMLADTVFKPTPSDQCRWCFYRANNKAKGGGQCIY